MKNLINLHCFISPTDDGGDGSHSGWEPDSGGDNEPVCSEDRGCHQCGLGQVIHTHTFPVIMNIFSVSSQLSTKFNLLLNVKTPTTVGNDWFDVQTKIYFECVFLLEFT